jgi:hypothetical protein
MERVMSFVLCMEFRAAPKGAGHCHAPTALRASPRPHVLDPSDWLISRTHCIMARDSGPLSHLGKLTPSVTPFLDC